MKIAFLGIRGIPATYSGFESFVEIFSRSLVKLGHEVTVYNRINHIKDNKNVYYGVKLVNLPTVSNKFLDTFVHTFLSVIHCLICDYELIYVCGVGNTLLTLILRLFRRKVILNVDGLDWKREKWGYFSKLFLKMSEYLSTIFPTITLTDSKVVQQYYRDTYNCNISYVPYFSNAQKLGNTGILEKFKLDVQKYILFVGRLVPENNAHDLVAAFEKLKTDYKLVIVGDAPYASEYIKKLKEHASEKIIFTGYQFDNDYRVLSSNAFLFVLPGQAGGTRVVLLDQMAFGNCIIVNNSNNNLEVVGDCAYPYSGDIVSLIKALEYLLINVDVVNSFKQKAKKRLNEKYSFKNIIFKYNDLIPGLL